MISILFTEIVYILFCRLLLETKYRRLPVVDSEGKLVSGQTLLPSFWSFALFDVCLETKIYQ
jgi:hypothetical protein